MYIDFSPQKSEELYFLVIFPVTSFKFLIPVLVIRKWRCKEYQNWKYEKVQHERVTTWPGMGIDHKSSLTGRQGDDSYLQVSGYSERLWDSCRVTQEVAGGRLELWPVGLSRSLQLPLMVTPRWRQKRVVIKAHLVQVPALPLSGCVISTRSLCSLRLSFLIWKLGVLLPKSYVCF